MHTPWQAEKITILLSGVNKFSLKAWSGQSIREQVMEIFIILDSNKNATTKFQTWKTSYCMCSR